MNGLEKIRLFLLDIDGTVCLEDHLIPGADRFLSQIRRNGGEFVFITNNTTRSVSDYIALFERLGVPTGPENFLTASLATADVLKGKYAQETIYVLGTESLMGELRQQGLRVTCDPEDPTIACVLASYDNQLTYQKLTDVSRLLTLRKDLGYMATNPDLVCPVDFGFVPDCGAICEMLEHAVKRRPIYIGKPSTCMVDMAIRRSRFEKEQALIVGDRLYTDIACANLSGVSAALVLSGESTRQELQESQYFADFVFPSVAELGDIWEKSREILTAG